MNFISIQKEKTFFRGNLSKKYFEHEGSLNTQLDFCHDTNPSQNQFFHTVVSQSND